MQGLISSLAWSSDQKSLYVSVSSIPGEPIDDIWRWGLDASLPERFVDNCGLVTGADPSGKYLLSVTTYGEKTGIYEISLVDRKCIPLLPGVTTINVNLSQDGKSFLYAVASGGRVIIYRQPWSGGQLIGAPQAALEVPFLFPLVYHGNAYDFSRDLSTIVYARPGGHADLYLLSQK